MSAPRRVPSERVQGSGPSARSAPAPARGAGNPTAEDLLAAIREAHAVYLSGTPPRIIFDRLLALFMSLTGSTGGFLDRIVTRSDGRPGNENIAMAGLMMNDSLERVRASQANGNGPASGRGTLTPVLIIPDAGDAGDRDGRMLIPLVCARDLVGIAGIAGSPGGYTEDLGIRLEPFTTACAMILHDVDRDRREEVQAEENRRQEEMIRALISNIPGTVYRCQIGAPWRMMVMTGEIQNLSGHPASRFLEEGGMAYADIVHPDDLPTVERIVAEGVERHRPYQVEYRILHANGGVRWVFERGCAFFDLAGRPEWLDGVIMDITDRKVAEMALREQEQKVRSILRAAPAGIGMVVHRVFREVNQYICDMTGYTRDELVGRNARMLYESDAEYERVGRVKYEQIARTGTGSIETRWQRKDGTIVDLILSSTPIDPANMDEGVTFTALDITERKAAEIQVQASLREKEVLLKEIHHRVKNNLQIISSLLSLQMSGITDPLTLEMFRESQNRVRSMALVHEKLYRAESLANVDFGEYIRALISTLMRSYARPGISCRVDADGIRLGVDLAIPCGLILNELVSNALKHAFTGRDTGSIAVRVARTPDGLLRMTVQDDGVGHRFGPAWATAPSMGTTLIRSLTEQVGGTMVMTTGPGTCFTLTAEAEPSQVQ